MTNREKYYAGFDIGSLSISAVVINENGELIHHGYQFHHGNVIRTLEEIIDGFSVEIIQGVGVNESGREFFRHGLEVNDQVALIEGVKSEIPSVGSVINIGGETFGLILFDDQGKYRKYISNSSCAAGTGSFLDQQASRLGLKDSASLAELAGLFKGEPPRIASRCAVFAKTDLTHAQQQGYSLEAIACGLCKGVVENIADTLFLGEILKSPVVITGGVAWNRKIIDYFREILEAEVIVPRHPELIAACGAAYSLRKYLSEHESDKRYQVREILRTETEERRYFYAPLITEGDGDSGQKKPEMSWIGDVEVMKGLVHHDGAVVRCYLGIDIGSTSTKAVLCDSEGNILYGLYTKTQGQPIRAVQRLTSVMEKIEMQDGIRFQLLAAGTTGSGRKFIERVTGADYVVDEITAHARAAYQLDPKIDTIIEIGGQDSKFTVMKDGVVTFSMMNYVCAAGTGSFIEEQAHRLGVPLEKYSELALHAPAPLTSDRCTVFMERDLNHLLAMGYSREELLAAALHSVRDNYLSKVAQINKIGSHIAFQGATARNLALVKAFEQKLKRSIYVSDFCHLTGAYGVCLKMMDELQIEKSGFRKDFHKYQIEVNEEVCEYCKNHCKINKVEIDGEIIGWGYLCGRDENDLGYKSRIKKEFDLLSQYRKTFIFRDDQASEQKATSRFFKDLKKGDIAKIIRKPYFSLAKLRNHLEFDLLDFRTNLFNVGVKTRKEKASSVAEVTIGIPNAFTMIEYYPLWRLFFKQLGFKVVTNSRSGRSLEDGKSLRRSEFCAPLTNFHGVIKEIASISDFVFFPHFFENSTDDSMKAYCYYTNYTVPLLANIPELDLNGKCMNPLIDFTKGTQQLIREIYQSFPPEIKSAISYSRTEEAFNLAWDWFQERLQDLKSIFYEKVQDLNDIGIVLIGRPYLFLDSNLNKGIPRILSEMDIRVFSMDMLPLDSFEYKVARKYLKHNHWNYGRTIIQATEIVAGNKKLFPIYITAFKCSPDSFLISYFREIMDYFEKPYLILQVDEHNTGEGYETRIEAAIRAFRSFEYRDSEITLSQEKYSKKWENKTYLIPSYDPISAKLVKAAFIRNGIRTMLIEETDETIKSSLRLNDGQCLPVSALAQAIAYTIDKYDLKPEKTALYVNAKCNLSCNLPQYPMMLKRMLIKLNPSFSGIDFHIGEYSMTDLPLELLNDVYISYLLSTILQKILCHIRPRELNKGETDAVFGDTLEKMVKTIQNGDSRESVLRDVIVSFSKIRVKNVELPQVGIVGDLYVRDNHVINRGLIREIEKLGAEAVIVPFLDGVNLLSGKHFQDQKIEGEYLNFFRDKLTLRTMQFITRKYSSIASPLLGEASPELKYPPLEYLSRYHLIYKHSGETVENLLKIFYLMENYSNLKLILHVNPIFCCPGLVSEAIFKQVEKDLGIPIVSITYDGTQKTVNDILKPYLFYLKNIEKIQSRI